MNQYLKEKLIEKLKSSDILMSDYKDLDENLDLDGINFQKVRGSVRLIEKMVFTPTDVQILKKKILSINLNK